MSWNAFKASVAGTEHIKRGIVCQDYASLVVDEKYVIGAVADGVGKAKHSEIGSEIAAKISVEMISKRLKCFKEHEYADLNVLEILKAAFATALFGISSKAVADENPVSDYLTTLCVCVYDGKNLYYGNIGDSGLIVLDTDGHYQKVTSNMQDDFGRLYPITFLDIAEYGVIKGPVGSVLMATDGLLNALAPQIISPKVNSAFASVFINDESFNPELDPKETETEITEFLSSVSGEKIYDDKTIVLIVDCDHKPENIEFEIFDFKKISEEKQRVMLQQEEGQPLSKQSCQTEKTLLKGGRKPNNPMQSASICHHTESHNILFKGPVYLRKRRNSGWRIRNFLRKRWK